MDCLEGTFKEQILTKKCPKHPLFYCDLLNMDPQTQQHRVCLFCVKEQGILNEQIIPIKNLLELNSSSKYPLYPLDESLIELNESDFELELISIQIDEYFSQLQQKINKALCIWIGEESLRIQNVITLFHQSKKKLENILKSNFTDIQSLLTQDSLSEISLHKAIQKRFFECKRENQNLRQAFAKIDQFQEKFSLSEPVQIQEQILSLIRSLNISKGDNMNRNIKFPFLHIKSRWEGSQFQVKGSSNYQNSVMDLGIVNKDGSIIISNKANNWRQCYLSQQLNPSNKYVIRIQLNNSFNYYPDFYFGLISSNLKDTESLALSDGIFYWEYNGGNTSTVTKGWDVHSQEGSYNIGKKELEFRIHINDQCWKVSSFPDYVNVAKLDDPQKINPQKNYHFAMMIGNQQDSITIFEVLELFEFDNKM